MEKICKESQAPLRSINNNLLAKHDLIIRLPEKGFFFLFFLFLHTEKRVGLDEASDRTPGGLPIQAPHGAPLCTQIHGHHPFSDFAMTTDWDLPLLVKPMASKAARNGPHTTPLGPTPDLIILENSPKCFGAGS